MPESPTVGLDDDVQASDVKVTAEPSSAEQNEGVVENKSMLDAVSSALKGGSEESPGSVTQDTEADPDANADPTTKVEGEALEPGDLNQEEMAQLSKKAQRRIRFLASVKNEQAGKIEGLAPKAEGFDQIVGLMQRNSLSVEDVNGGFQIMGLIKANPEEALKRLVPIVRGLLQHTGYRLPDDLKQEVDAGAITEARARELAVTRARSTNLETQNKQAEERRQAEDNARGVRAVVGLATKTADSWQAEQAKSDPDWPLKHTRFLEKIELKLTKGGFEGYPKTQKDAVKLFEDTKKEVDDELKKFRPRAQSRTPVSGSGASSSGAKPEPKTMEEAITIGLAQK